MKQITLEMRAKQENVIKMPDCSTKIPEGYVRCVTFHCGKIIPEKEARHYGAGPVCQECYDRWSATED